MEKHFFSFSAALLYDPFYSKEIIDISISCASTFTQHLDSLPSNSIKFMFLYLTHCSAVITLILLLLLP